jgi:hypothetical protein
LELNLSGTRENLGAGAKEITSRLKSYLAGLYEGDGHITINKKSAHLCITFNIKDLPVAEKLKEVLGHGWIRIKSKENACVFTIQTKAGLVNIIYLINGEFRTPKVDKFYQLIDFVNQKESLNIPKLPLNNKPLGQDAWLAGFIDADGGFQIRNNKKTETTKRRISCKLVIEQRMTDPITQKSYYDILTNISQFLECNLLIRKQVKTGREYYCITATSLLSISKVVEYLYTFPLYSSKFLDYKNWREVVHFMLENKHYEVDSNYIDNLKDNMNSTRTEFNWDHLNNLY